MASLTNTPRAAVSMISIYIIWNYNTFSIAKLLTATQILVKGCSLTLRLLSLQKLTLFNEGERLGGWDGFGSNYYLVGRNGFLIAGQWPLLLTRARASPPLASRAHQSGQISHFQNRRRNYCWIVFDNSESLNFRQRNIHSATKFCIVCHNNFGQNIWWSTTVQLCGLF